MGKKWVDSAYPYISINQFGKSKNELLVKMKYREFESPSKLYYINVDDSRPDSILWKYLFFILGGLLVLATLGYIRERNLRNSVNQKISQIRSKRKLASSQQKVLQLEMNPHFLFNSLNSIKGLIANGHNKEARLYLSKFANMMRSVLEGSKEEQITIEEEVKFLENYLSLERMCRNNAFDYQIDLTDAVDAQILIPAMMIQPFVENSIIHGVKQLSDRKGLIKIQLSKQGGRIVCSIEDNGNGRIAKNEISKHKSYASDIVNGRLKSLGFAKLEIQDLKNKVGRGIGTKVILRLS